jgi:superfamily II DNA helicase RecQ
MSATVDAVQQRILDAAPNWSRWRHDATELECDLAGAELARARGAARLGLAWAGLETGETGLADLTPLLRQVIRGSQTRLRVPTAIWEQLRDQGGLRATGGDDATVELVADDWTPAWLAMQRGPANAQLDVLAARRTDPPAAGSGTLRAMRHVSGYLSAAQKAAVEAAQFAPPGSTTLVTLPTGGGKSLCALLPAWQESHGGRVPGGTTLVIVPTVALALDQQRQAELAFPDAWDASRRPQAWTGDTDADTRSRIRRGIADGTLPLLFTSPEALLQHGLHDICLEAAATGQLRRLVIDEAHIVETWGAGFRSEFQFLATYRRKLLAASGGALRTLLLSATVREECDMLLQRLFAEPGSFQRLRANRLRPEPAYWLLRCDHDAVRNARLLAALPYLPRPLILYVTRPVTAADWLARLRAEGYRRCASFTGETDDDARGQLLRAWQRADLDIMVATSAFGLGVDNGDVRAVVHACLPENLDRFYQEVGRGGRDGNASVSLLCTAPEDRNLAIALGTRAVITTDKAISRWEGMRRTSEAVPGRGNVLLLDTDAQPLHDLDMWQGARNREWNEHTLLLMQRAGLLDIDDTAATADTTSVERLQVTLRQPDVFAELSSLALALEKTRAQERERVSADVREMEDFACGRGPGAMRCASTTFTRLYPDCAPACGGCPACRAAGRAPWSRPQTFALERDGLRVTAPEPRLAAWLAPLLLGRDPLLLQWSALGWLRAPGGLVDVLAGLVGNGLRQLIVPDELLADSGWLDQLTERLSAQASTGHLVPPTSWLCEHADIPLRGLPTVVVYPEEATAADRVHGVFQRRRTRELHDAPVIVVAQRGLYLASEHGLLADRVNGLTEDVERFQARLVTDDLDSF